MDGLRVYRVYLGAFYSNTTHDETNYRLPHRTTSATLLPMGDSAALPETGALVAARGCQPVRRPSRAALGARGLGAHEPRGARSGRLVGRGMVVDAVLRQPPRQLAVGEAARLELQPQLHVHAHAHAHVHAHAHPHPHAHASA